MSEQFSIDAVGTPIVADCSANFSLEPVHTYNVAKFLCQETTYKIEFTNIPDNFIDTLQFLDNLMENVTQKIKIPMKSEKDQMRVYINHPDLSVPISFPFIKRDQFQSDMIVKYISKILQSNKKITLDNKLVFRVFIRFSPNGGAKNKRVIDFIINKHTLVSVKSEKDQLCGLRAIIIGKR
jgi:hypothetical protein